jgi:dsRNA-specific ribonuclease
MLVTLEVLIEHIRTTATLPVAPVIEDQAILSTVFTHHSYRGLSVLGGDGQARDNEKAEHVGDALLSK